MRIEKKLWIALIVFGLFAVGFTGWIFNRSMGGERVSFNNTVRLETEADTAGEIKTKNLVLPEEFDIPRSLLFKTTHTSVQILLDGEEISGLSENRMAEIRNKTLGFVFQHADLLPELTALDNVALPLLYRGVRKKERRARAAEVLEKVGLGDRMEFYPNQMSGGQCQRAAIARAIVGNPKLLLADEPTGALDSQSGKNIMQLFRQLNQEGITIITITHAAEVAQEADKCFHIYDGELFTDREVSAR